MTVAGLSLLVPLDSAIDAVGSLLSLLEHLLKTCARLRFRLFCSFLFFFFGTFVAELIVVAGSLFSNVLAVDQFGGTKLPCASCGGYLGAAGFASPANRDYCCTLAGSLERL